MVKIINSIAMMLIKVTLWLIILLLALANMVAFKD